MYVSVNDKHSKQRYHFKICRKTTVIRRFNRIFFSVTMAYAALNSINILYSIRSPVTHASNCKMFNKNCNEYC